MSLLLPLLAFVLAVVVVITLTRRARRRRASLENSPVGAG
jgi:uncharacterized membrane protein YoaK (UPF0700 family)